MTLSDSGLSPVIAGDVDEIVARALPWDRLAHTTVLVTGANGMLPSYAVYTLLALNDRLDAGITVLGLVRNEKKARAVLAPILDRPDFRLIVGDVANPLDLPGPLDYVIHGASAARPSLHGADPVGTIKANVVGTLNLLDLCVAKGSRGFVLMSSAEIYGAQPPGTELIGEDSYGGFDILNPRACYSEGKRAAETMCAVYQAQHGITCRAARFGHVYGPGLALDDGRVQADFAANVVAGRDIVLNSDGSSVRTYTYVGDATAGLFYALLLGTEPAYNVADTGGLVAIRRLAELFTQARPERGLRLVFTHESDARAYSPVKGQGLDSARLAGLGWAPVVDLRTGIDRMVTAAESAAAAQSADAD
jgi:UDP-glucuronate decarboxylase